MNIHTTTKSRYQGQAAIIAAVALAALWLMGCKTPPYRSGDLAADSSLAAANQLQKERQALTTTLTTLTNLMKQPATDIKARYLAFSTSLDALIDVARRGEVTASNLSRSNDLFFAGWDKQLTSITNIDIKRRSVDRRNQVSAQFRTANDRYTQAREQLWFLINYCEDVRRALGTDLTRQGIDAIKPLVQNIGNVASNVQTAMVQAHGDIAAISMQMSSTRSELGPH